MKNLTTTLCLTIAVLLGSMGVSWSGDWEKGWEAFKRGDYDTMKRELMPLAIQGHHKSQSIIGHLLMGGWDGKNIREGIEWIKLAAKGGVYLSGTNKSSRGAFKPSYGTKSCSNSLYCVEPLSA
jgi:hypothetical protein